ncbi:MAG: ammonia-forming cytochrome c nitrite reductase subunit c552 [Deltaproteobacteria bacterium]|nr:ammonia-forming cytochrome c nitrite reductase subunit c552 [Deltaproteobacteria bacterium]
MPQTTKRKISQAVAGLGILLLATAAGGAATPPDQGAFTGSQSCRECHEKFYRLWAPSHHGRAMQAYSDEFAAANLTPMPAALTIQGVRYQAQTGPGQGWLLATEKGQKTRLPIQHALGGKNIFYFLTPLAAGRLQTLPLAYDLHRKEWFDTAKSGLRHAGDQPVDWRDSTYTFNTSCHGCHVSQYRQNYDPATRTYHTTWREPGINCETCHGPGEAHIRVCRAAPQGQPPQDLRITRGGRSFTARQNNDTCATCHAKAIPLTRSFAPGDNFWDHFDLALLDHADYYPDGRDLGENYTLTSWLLSPCVRAGGLSCLHCHTSSGRFRQKDQPQTACLPCHAARVTAAAAHSHHKPGQKSSQGAPTCVSCHMPQTSFARMHRSDHSMLPPTPAATRQFGSPNACQNCHREKDAAWADRQVRRWHQEDYQAPILARAGLVAAARERDWSRLPEMLAYVARQDRDPVFAASLLRLLGACPQEAKWPAFLAAAGDPHPLVRATALAGLQDHPAPEVAPLALTALNDPTRLVRLRAAQALHGRPAAGWPLKVRQRLAAVDQELLASLLARPDTWHANYNAGNFYLEQGQMDQAAAYFETALALEPRALPPLVNLALTEARRGHPDQARQRLEQALAVDPKSAPAHYNLGLLLAEQDQAALAAEHLRAALQADPQMAPAAFNLGLLLAKQDPAAARRLCQQAYELSPNPRYGFTLAWLESQGGDTAGAVRQLGEVMATWPGYADAPLLLAEIHAQAGRLGAAREVLAQALATGALSPRDQQRLAGQLARLSAERAPTP